LIALLDEAATRQKSLEFVYNSIACPIPGTIAQESTMNSADQTRFDGLYRRHLRALKLQGMSESTMDVYARAVRRVAHYYDCCPDQLTTEQLKV
jgi:hypothetical protein